MGFNANIFQTHLIFTPETVRSPSINVTETSNETKEVIENLENKVDILTNEVTSLKQIICKQTVILEQIAKHLRPTCRDLKIFPINTLDELNTAEQLIETEPDSEVISYIKFRFDKVKIEEALRKMMGDNILLKLNWDGSKNKTALNKYKLFNYFYFQALKDTFETYPEYEKSFKLAFRKCKATVYQQTYALKATTSSNPTNKN